MSHSYRERSSMSTGAAVGASGGRPDSSHGEPDHCWMPRETGCLGEARELGLDNTLSETFPCSDPLSSIPNPSLHM